MLEDAGVTVTVGVVGFDEPPPPPLLLPPPPLPQAPTERRTAKDATTRKHFAKRFIQEVL